MSKQVFRMIKQFKLMTGISTMTKPIIRSTMRYHNKKLKPKKMKQTLKLDELAVSCNNLLLHFQFLSMWHACSILLFNGGILAAYFFSVFD